ncbi:hypothetical protein CLIB1444_10S04940 [[Candida] jaroonii]|uniref:Uncharacterized protein n=1 Tax=[Candida] jaroonii TaxID=467808 RepID=A0ACA9YDS5_9ASCO|nr:hypothetical protein CLIB1444_10S04940 [[Candida] jaroonii]
MNSNEDEILSPITKAISKVREQFILKDGEVLNFTNIINVYTEVLKLIHFFPYDIDLFSPLLNILDYNGWQEFHKEMVCLVTIVGLEHLTNRKLFPKMREIMLNNETISKILILSGGASKINFGVRGLALSELNPSLFEGNIDILTSKCLATLVKFTNLKNIQSLIDIVSKSYEFEPWQSLLNFLIDDNELVSIMVAQSPDFFANTSNYPDSKFIKDITINVLSYDHFDLIRDLVQPKLIFPSSWPSNVNLVTSFKALFSLIDNGISELENEPTLIVYANWSLNQIIAYTELPQGKADIYAVYNSLRPIVSVAVFFQKLAIYLLNGKGEELPPMAKPEWMLDDWVNKIEDFPDTRAGHVSAATKSLQLVSLFISDELVLFRDSKDPLMLQCYVSRVKSIFEILNPKRNEMQPLIPILVTILNKIDSPIIWSHMLSLLQDLCFEDLKLVKICNSILLEFIDEKREFIEPFVNFFGGNDEINRFYNLPPVKYVEFQQFQ